jgi:hypothetical protein
MADPRALLSHRNQFEKFVKFRDYPLSSYHFSAIFLWSDFFEFDFQVIDGYLCVFAKHRLGTFLYLPPLGASLNTGIIEKCFDELNRLNARKTSSRIENLTQEDLVCFDSQKYRIVEKSKEYSYQGRDIAELRGNKFKSKRSSYNQFVKNNRHQWIGFDRRCLTECRELYDHWAQNRKAANTDDIYQAMLEENRQVHERIFQYYDEIGLEGRLVLVDEKPQAYTFGYPLNDDTFCVLVEITNLNIKGLSVYTFSRFCADQFVRAYPFINVMDDFAMDNIARVKESFHPTALYPSYVVMERE